MILLFDLQIILNSSKQLCLLINDILDSASLKQGTYQMHLGKVDVGLAISQVDCRHLGLTF